MTLLQGNCPRCGGKHEVDYIRLRFPANIRGLVMSHWYMCPFVHEPVMVATKPRLPEPPVIDNKSRAAGESDS